ncbi:MAG: hypothetical protein IJX56_03310, partial [Alistipes sp.]|nr:hypothetical protein [Alistipes sp.]
MKKMLKSALVLASALMTLGASAQEDPKKETVILDPFTRVSGVSQLACENVRSAVKEGFSTVARFDLVDAVNDSRVAGLVNGRKAEELVTDENWQTESAAVYKSLNATSLIKGQVELDSEYTKTDEEGKVWYYNDVNFTLTVINLTDGSTTGTKSYSYHGLSSTSVSDAFNTDVLPKISKDMQQFCNEFFKVETYILELGEADKKGAIKDLYLAGGTEVGVQKGSIFKVYAEKKIGPKVIKSEIGELKATEVMDGATVCQILKGGDVIKEKFLAEEKLSVVLDRKRGDGAKELGRMFGF